MKYTKQLKRGARKVYKKVIKPYRKRTNRMKLYQEVNAIKKMVNAEKKTAETTINALGVGQLANAIDGVVAQTITPVIAQGVTFSTRNGRSIKLSGAYIRGKFVAQTNVINKIKFNMTILTYKGRTQTSTDIIGGMYNVDSLSGLRDYFAPRNPDAYTDYRIITSRNYTMYPDSISGQTGIIDFIMPLKLKHHLRYNQNSNTIEEGELFIIIRADSGDSGTPSTGAFFSLSVRLTYYDN